MSKIRIIECKQVRSHWDDIKMRDVDDRSEQRKAIETKLKIESNYVRKDSMKVLKEFENIELL